MISPSRRLLAGILALCPVLYSAEPAFAQTKTRNPLVESLADEEAPDAAAPSAPAAPKVPAKLKSSPVVESLIDEDSEAPAAAPARAKPKAGTKSKANPLVESLSDDEPEAEAVAPAKAAPKAKPKAKANPLVESLADDDEDETPAETTTEDPAAEETAESGATQNTEDAEESEAPVAARAGLDVAAVERLALEQHPILAEKSLQVAKSEEQVRNLDMSVILPRFEVETGIGPAPGIRTINRGTLQTLEGDTLIETGRRFDFSEWGPFFGIEATVAQPLNIGRYRAGRKAATLQVRVSEAEFKKEQLLVSEEAQTLYYQRLYALTLLRELTSARKELDRAQKRLSDQLDAEEGNVSQTDVLQLRSGRYSLDQGWNEANLGVSRSALGLSFLLNRDDTAGVALADTGLSLRREALPSLQDLKLAALRSHPDLLRLRNGMAARHELLKVAQGELGPDIFLFGNFKYSKVWSSDRQSGGDDPFARDPLNELTAVAGLGMRLRLNVWSGYQKFRKERLELRQLERTEVYAARGILLRVEDAWVQMLKAKADADEAQKALRAAEAWLKGVAMKYDLDGGGGTDLVAPFKQSLTAKRDYYKAVFEYNVAVAKTLTSAGWTLSDYLGNLSRAGDAPAEEPNK